MQQNLTIEIDLVVLYIGVLCLKTFDTNNIYLDFFGE